MKTFLMNIADNSARSDDYGARSERQMRLAQTAWRTRQRSAEYKQRAIAAMRAQNGDYD